MTSPIRTVSTKLELNASQYKRELVDATGITTKLADEINRTGALASQKASELAKSAQEQQQAQQQALAAADRLGRGMIVAGAGIAAGIGLAARAAVNWESAWAGVEKTVDGSATQLSALEGELREMARRLPATHAEIAAVAEAAGQLGVATEDIADFTETMIALGETTNLTADEAATSIAQLMNVMGTAPEEVGNLGSALVELGNNGASTEKQIILMAQRIAGAGAIVGASEADVLALANALASAGIEVEAGGSAISRVMVNMATAVAEGGDELEAFARVAGMSGEQFAVAFRDDPVAAIDSFVQGLARIDASGQNVFATLDELGLSEIRTRDALLRLASSGDLLSQSLEDGGRAWEENLALTEEAEKRYETTAAKIQVAQNQLNDFAIEMGAVFLPVLADAADGLGSFVGFLGGLPDPLRNTVAVLAAATAAILLLGGTALLAVSKIAAYKLALMQLNAVGGTSAVVTGRINRGLRGTVAWAGRALGVIAALQIAGQAAGAALGNDFAPQLDALTEGVARFGQTGEIGGEAARLLGDDFQHLGEALRVLGPEGVGPNIGNAIKSVVEWTGVTADMQGSLKRSREEIGAYDQALANLVQGGRTAEAAASFERLTQLAAENGVSVERLAELFPVYAAALETAAEQGGVTEEGMTELGTAAVDAAAQVEELTAAFDELFGVEMDLDRAQIAYKEGMAELIEILDDGASSLSTNTEAGRENRTGVLDQIDAIKDLRQANIDNGMSMEEADARYVNQLGLIEEMLIERGFEKEAVQNLIDTYRDIPEEVSTDVQAPMLGPKTREAELYDEILGRVKNKKRLTTIMALPNANARLRELRNYLRELNSIDGRVVTSTIRTVNENITRNFGVNAPQANRHGGITLHAQSGLLRHPAIFTPRSPARFAFAEPATGGEAFIPRIGDRMRSLAIADVAARWHGGRVVAGDAGARGASLGSWQRAATHTTVPIVNVYVTAQPGQSEHQLADALIQTIRFKVRTDGGGDVQRALGQGR